VETHLCFHKILQDTKNKVHLYNCRGLRRKNVESSFLRFHLLLPFWRKILWLDDFHHSRRAMQELDWDMQQLDCLYSFNFLIKITIDIINC